MACCTLPLNACATPPGGRTSRRCLSTTSCERRTCSSTGKPNSRARPSCARERCLACARSIPGAKKIQSDLADGEQRRVADRRLQVGAQPLEVVVARAIDVQRMDAERVADARIRRGERAHRREVAHLDRRHHQRRDTGSERAFAHRVAIRVVLTGVEMAVGVDQHQCGGGAGTGGGRRCAHGRARSSWPASRSSVASSPKRPTKCMPIGSPASFQRSGTHIAGWPVALNSGVYGIHAKVFDASACAVPARAQQPAGAERVDDSHRGTLGAHRLQRADPDRRCRQRRREQHVVALEEPGTPRAATCSRFAAFAYSEAGVACPSSPSA